MSASLPSRDGWTEMSEWAVRHSIKKKKKKEKKRTSLRSIWEQKRAIRVPTARTTPHPPPHSMLWNNNLLPPLCRVVSWRGCPKLLIFPSLFLFYILSSNVMTGTSKFKYKNKRMYQFIRSTILQQKQVDATKRNFIPLLETENEAALFFLQKSGCGPFFKTDGSFLLFFPSNQHLSTHAMPCHFSAS